jgi:ferredoxin
MVLRELACFLEDEGYEGGVWRNTGGRGPLSDLTGDPEESAEYGRRIRYTEPVSPDKPAPDVFLHFRIGAYICGLGEIGYSKIFLTPEFGPRQRFAFMFTDAPLEPDPIYDGPPICDRCKLCVANCPPHAISGTETVTVTVAGRELEWAKIAEWQCFYAYMGGIKEINPFLPRDAFDELPDGDKIMRGEKILSPTEVLEVQKIVSKYYPAAAGYNNAMCGGRGCLRACMVHLEEQGKTTRKFHRPFRTKKLWKL